MISQNQLQTTTGLSSSLVRTSSSSPVHQPVAWPPPSASSPLASSPPASSTPERVSTYYGPVVVVLTKDLHTYARVADRTHRVPRAERVRHKVLDQLDGRTDTRDELVRLAMHQQKPQPLALEHGWPAPTASPDRQKALPAPRVPQSAAASALPSADATLHLSLPPSLLAALCHTFHLALGHWPWLRRMCLPETAFSHCRALRSRASSEELKARKKLKNLELCQHAASAKFEKAIPLRTRAPTHSDAPTTLAPCVVGRTTAGEHAPVPSLSSF